MWVHQKSAKTSNFGFVQNVIWRITGQSSGNFLLNVTRKIRMSVGRWGEGGEKVFVRDRVRENKCDHSCLWHSVLQCVGMCCSVLQCVAVRCSVLQCDAVCCSVYVALSPGGAPKIIKQQSNLPNAQPHTHLCCIPPTPCSWQRWKYKMRWIFFAEHSRKIPEDLLFTHQITFRTKSKLLVLADFWGNPLLSSDSHKSG